MSLDSCAVELHLSDTDPLLGLKWGEPIAVPQAITFDFYAVYETEASFTPFPENESLQLITAEGVTDYAPFGLTNLRTTSYSTLPDENGNFRFSADPADFGLEGELLIDTFFGTGINKLFGTSSGSGSIDFNQGIILGSGTFTITGGQGLLQGATGTLNFTDTATLAGETGTAVVTGNITVPFPFESSFVAGL